MSTYQSIDDAIYSTPDFQIIRKKKSPAMGIIITLAGVAVLIANPTLSQSSANLSTGLLFIGVVLIAFGAINAAVAIFGKGGTPIYKPSGAKVIRHKVYYDFSKRDKVCALVKAGDFDKLAAIERSESSAIVVVIYRSTDNSLLLAQVFEFVPHYYQPFIETLSFAQGEYKFNEALIR